MKLSFKIILDFIIKYKEIFFTLAFVIILMLLLSQCNKNIQLKRNLKHETQRWQQNLFAKDSIIEIYKNMADEITYSKAIAIMSSSEVKEHFPELYEKIANEIDPKIIITTEIIYKDTGSTQTQLGELENNQYSLEFDYVSLDSVLFTKGFSIFTANPIMIDEECGIMDLEIFPGIIKFTDTKILFGLTLGIKTDKNGIDKIFVTPSSNKITITDIEGVDLGDYVDSKFKNINRKGLSIGPSLGYGIMFKGNSEINHGIFVGVSLNYNLIRF